MLSKSKQMKKRNTEMKWEIKTSLRHKSSHEIAAAIAQLTVTAPEEKEPESIFSLGL